MVRLAVVGLGLRAAWLVSTLRRADPSLRLVAVADPSTERATARLGDAGASPSDAPPRFVPDVAALVGGPRDFDAVLVGTRCDLHADTAVALAALDVPVFLEKPVAITAGQVDRLAGAFAGRLGADGRVVVSFPLRVSPLFRSALDVVASGRLGAVNQITAVNYVPYGGVYFGQWYRDYEATGGLWLQKATHDFDYLFALADAAGGGRPTSVAAAETRGYFGGDMPDDLRCSDCALVNTCPEGPPAQARRGDAGGMADGPDGGTPGNDHWCAFGRSIRHHDAGSAILRFASGLHASYAQNFVTRRSAAARGARVTGSRATLEFDWVAEVVRVTEHHGTAVDERRLAAAENHSGGDDALAANFLAVVRGDAESASPLAAGLLSVAACLAARSSAKGDAPGFVPIERTAREPRPREPCRGPAGAEPVAGAGTGG